MNTFFTTSANIPHLPRESALSLLRWFTAVILVFFTSVGLASDKCPPEISAPNQAQVEQGIKAAKNRGYLWQISKDGHASYLYGTIHVGKFEWTFPGKNVVQALQSTDVIALEINPLDENSIHELKYGIAADRDKPTPKALQKRIDSLAKKNCVPVDLLRPMRIEMQVVTLTEMIARKDGLEPAYGIDLQLAAFGMSAHRPVESLETVSTQLSALLGGDPDMMMRDTEDSLKQLESGRERASLLKVANAWATSDFETLSTYMDWCNCVNTDAEKLAAKRLLDERNPNMAKRLDALHAKGHRVFAAVGALHMTGKTGLPELMSQLGYVVQRVF